MHRALWAVIALISYGSLYPFGFDSPFSLLAAWNAFIVDRHLWTSIGDVFGNVLLFAPFGAITMLGGGPARTVWMRIIWAFMLGFALAFVLQVLQIWVPSRSAALSDVFWNLVGTALGMAFGLWIGVSRRSFGSQMSNEDAWVAALVASWLVVELAPFVPSLDWSGIKTNLKPLLTNPSISPVSMLFNAALVLLLGELLSSIRGPFSPNLLLIALLTLMTAVRPIVVAYPLSLTTVLGHIIGLTTWLSLHQRAPSQRTTVVVITLLSVFTLQGFSPFLLRDTPAVFHWLPFEAMLEGSMVANARSLAQAFLVLGGVLVLVHRQGGSVPAVALGLAFWVGMIEVVQLWFAEHTSDVTWPLLALAIGYALQRGREVSRISRTLSA